MVLEKQNDGQARRPEMKNARQPENKRNNEKGTKELCHTHGAFWKYHKDIVIPRTFEESLMTKEIVC